MFSRGKGTLGKKDITVLSVFRETEDCRMIMVRCEKVGLESLMAVLVVI